MSYYQKLTVAVLSLGGMVAIAFAAGPETEKPNSSNEVWEYRVWDVAVIDAPIAVINPNATEAELKVAQEAINVQSQINTEWPKNIPNESVHEFERRLAEFGAEGWELVLKDRNMVIFTRLKR